MRIPRRIALTTKLTLVCLLAAAALAQASGFRVQPDGAAVPARKAAFKITGQLSGLYPGQKTTLRVRVTNNNGHTPIKITRIAAKVRSANAACPASTLKITPYKGKKRLNGHASATLSLPAQLSASAPDACQGNRFQLAYKGKARA